MAVAKKLSMAAELLQKVSPMPYKTHVATITEKDALAPDTFKNSKWANYFMVDYSNVVKNGWEIPIMCMIYLASSVVAVVQKYESIY